MPIYSPILLNNFTIPFVVFFCMLFIFVFLRIRIKWVSNRRIEWITNYYNFRYDQYYRFGIKSTEAKFPLALDCLKSFNYMMLKIWSWNITDFIENKEMFNNVVEYFNKYQPPDYPLPKEQSEKSDKSLAEAYLKNEIIKGRKITTFLGKEYNLDDLSEEPKKETIQ